MVTIGIDAHKRTHTIVVADEQGRQLATRTIGTTTADHLELLSRARRYDDDQLFWAVEDCRHLSRRLERDLLTAGERIVRVPPKLMANARTAARSFGKSDPIDALAVARAALHLRNLNRLAERLGDIQGTVARIARQLVARCRALPVEINERRRSVF